MFNPFSQKRKIQTSKSSPLPNFKQSNHNRASFQFKSFDFKSNFYFLSNLANKIWNIFKTNRLLQFFCVLIFLFAISIAIFKNKDFLTIKTINCKVNTNPCSQDYLTIIEGIKNANLLSFNTIKFNNYVKNLNPAIKNIEMKKHYPDTLDCHFILREPTAVLISKTQGNYYLIDEDLVAFAQTDNTELTHINWPQSINLGEEIADNTIKAVLILQKEILQTALVNNPNEFIIEVVNGQEIIVNLSNFKLKVFFTAKTDIHQQVNALQLILRDSKMDTKKGQIKEIDIRFQEPVLRY